MAEHSASVVVPTRGGAGRLPALLRALAAQTHPDTEVVVVVDGDTDGSADVLTGWAGRLDLHPVVLPENRGRSAALNAGFAVARGEVLLRCDDDLEPTPEHVARHVAHHLGEGRVGVIGLCPNVFPDTPYAAAYGRVRDRRFAEAAYAMSAGLRWRLWGANVSVARETWAAVGPYDEEFRAYGWEDVDWGYRLHRAGAALIVDPHVAAPHHGAATTTRVRARRAFHSGAARHAFEAKHGDAALGHDASGRTAWDGLVGAVSAVAGPRGVDALAAAADATVGHLPAHLGEKAVALVVEAAARSGYRRPRSTGLSV